MQGIQKICKKGYKNIMQEKAYTQEDMCHGQLFIQNNLPTKMRPQQENNFIKLNQEEK